LLLLKGERTGTGPAGSRAPAEADGPSGATEEPPRPSDNRLPYMPGIDALRAIAVLAVFFYHVGAGWMPGGFLGVDVFFVISGYLITALLLSEFGRRGHISVIAFWLRRARRLLPAVAVMIAATLLLAAIVVPEEIDRLRGDALASLFYVNNWHLILAHQSYFQQFGRPSLFLHLWSLSVEEQFYLLWPLCFAAGMSLLGRRRLVLGVIAGALLSTLLMIILFDPSNTNRVFLGTDTRAVGLLLGVALALAWHPNDLRAAAGRRAGLILDAIGLFALAMIVNDFVNVYDFQSSLYHGGFLLLALWTTLLVGVLAHPAAHLGRVLSFRVLGERPLLWLGVRSYSFYLYHWPILALTRPGLDVPLHGPLLVTLQLGATLVLADLSYRYVEQPFRHRRDSAKAPSWLVPGRVALAAGVLASVLVIGWSGIVPTGGESGVGAAQAQGPARVVLGDNGKSGGALRPGDQPQQQQQPVTQSDQGAASQAPGPGVGGPAAPKVLAIGDSVMRGAAADLVKRLGGDVVVDAEEGRQPSTYASVIDAYRTEGKLASTVVVQLGNNGPVWYADLTALRSALAGVPHVYLVNVEVPRSWQDEVNSELASFLKSWPQATLVDWHDTVSGDIGGLTYDGIHLKPAGQQLYTNLIRKALQSG
jgi:peptidoglycan/LPS O-acetylase OafA/YrhL